MTDQSSTREVANPEQRMHVPFVDLKCQAQELREEYQRVIWDVIDRAAYTLGPELQRFESHMAQLAGTDNAIGVSSGTDAVKLALLSAGVRAGDEVIVPANTFIATAEGVSHIGATPVFVDCDPDTALIDVEKIPAAITDRTTAIVPVHLYGQPADMDELLAIASARGLIVIEDACQAHGARYKDRAAGSLGHAAAFSFYPGKNLGALGDGGAVTTSDPEIDAKVRLYRHHGQEGKNIHSVIGYTDRLHNLQAALLDVKIEYLPAWNESRREAARLYDEAFLNDPAIRPITRKTDRESVLHLYVIRVKDRDEVRARLGEVGVESGIHYPIPLHLQPAYAHLGHGAGDFPAAEALATDILSLPMYPQITRQQVEYVVESVRNAIE